MLVPDQDVIVQNRRDVKQGRSWNSADDKKAKEHSWVAKCSKFLVNPYHTLSALCDVSNADYCGTCLTEIFGMGRDCLAIALC